MSSEQVIADRSCMAVLSCLRDSAQLSTLPKWCRGELSTAADLIEELQARNAEQAAEIERLQVALARWLPMVGSDGSEASEQVGDDAMLLVGMESPTPREYGVEMQSKLTALLDGIEALEADLRARERFRNDIADDLKALRERANG